MPNIVSICGGVYLGQGSHLFRREPGCSQVWHGFSHSPALISTFPAQANLWHPKSFQNMGDRAWQDFQDGSGWFHAGQHGFAAWDGGHDQGPGRGWVPCTCRAWAPHHPAGPCQGWVPHTRQVCPASPPGLPAEHGLEHRHQ